MYTKIILIKMVNFYFNVSKHTMCTRYLAPTQLQEVSEDGKVDVTPLSWLYSRRSVSYHLSTKANELDLGDNNVDKR